MASALTDIGARLTPSVPIELTFGAQPAGVGTKFVTLIGHKAASGGTAADYFVYQVTNVGDDVAAKLEIDALAGVNSEISLMVQSFVQANLLAGRSNFPNFRVLMLPSTDMAFGTNDIGITQIKGLRSDMIVSCYPAENAANLLKLQNLAVSISGADRDLQGQFGTFVVTASTNTLAVQQALAINSRNVLVFALPDSNSATVTAAATTTANSAVLTAISTAGIYPGAVVSGTGIAAGSTVVAVDGVSVTLSAVASATGTAVSITFVNALSQTAAQIASAAAAARMATPFPYCPVQGVEIGGLVAPQKRSDWIDINPNGASEQTLAAGISPLVILPGNVVGFLRTRTTYTTLPSGIAATTYFDWEELVTMNDFREVCYQICENPPFNNNPGGAKASAAMAKLLKGEILRAAKSFEDQNAFQNVNQLAQFFVVQVSTIQRGRFDFRIPVDVIPGLYVIAGNIVGVVYTEDFTL